ncbi:MAG: hypothetical protein QHH24_00685 [Candidatus Bathyarchaeota archaeon]|jgi:hypothetical protein|nr:hypothetical protein [Candidatus Bathyarchaeota archaeon]
MPAKIRVEVSDDEGNKYTIALEGRINREKAQRLLDMVELLGGVSDISDGHLESNRNLIEGIQSKYEKMKLLLKKNFPLVWFSSHEVQTLYEQEIKEPVSLSTVSTYLSRMTAQGVLLKNGAGNNLRYKLVSSIPQISSNRQTP